MSSFSYTGLNPNFSRLTDFSNFQINTHVLPNGLNTNIGIPSYAPLNEGWLSRKIQEDISNMGVTTNLQIIVNGIQEKAFEKIAQDLAALNLNYGLTLSTRFNSIGALPALVKEPMEGQTLLAYNVNSITTDLEQPVHVPAYLPSYFPSNLYNQYHVQVSFSGPGTPYQMLPYDPLNGSSTATPTIKILTEAVSYSLEELKEIDFQKIKTHNAIVQLDPAFLHLHPFEQKRLIQKELLASSESASKFSRLLEPSLLHEKHICEELEGLEKACKLKLELIRKNGAFDQLEQAELLRAISKGLDVSSLTYAEVLGLFEDLKQPLSLASQEDESLYTSLNIDIDLGIVAYDFFLKEEGICTDDKFSKLIQVMLAPLPRPSILMDSPQSGEIYFTRHMQNREIEQSLEDITAFNTLSLGAYGIEEALSEQILDKPIITEVGKTIFDALSKAYDIQEALQAEANPLAIRTLKNRFWKEVKGLAASYSVLKEYLPFRNQEIVDGSRTLQDLAQVNVADIDNPHIELMALEQLEKQILPSEVINVGEKELTNAKFIMVPGIKTFKEKAMMEAHAISGALKGAHVTLVHNPSQGFINDLMRAIRGQNCIASDTSYRLKEVMMEFLNTSAKDSKIYIQCHSEGAIVTRNALLMIPEHLRQRIVILGLAPAASIEVDGLENLRMYASEWDLVPHLDAFNIQQGNFPLTILEPAENAPFFDHAVSSPTFEPLKEDFYKGIMNE